ncbi:uncharacterized protein LOC125939734 [Dermacentor silvarum]|uniref:uncharacterized protein LOC125939734 n=1 Tax=Dermacentor silvarum TaxID=543639 RepID=UPI0021013A60|nr:uncharacterized protein LOC125939734 [Dermacentor silvarum]
MSKLRVQRKAEEAAVRERKQGRSRVLATAERQTVYHSDHKPNSPHPPPGNVLATPESAPMSPFMVECLEELDTTPLMETGQPTLVDFTPDSPELKASSTPCCKLCQSPEKEAPKDVDNSTENWLTFAQEDLRANILRTSTPQQLSPSVSAFETSFTGDPTDAPKDIPSDEGKVGGPCTLVPRVLASGARDAPSSPGLVTHGKAVEYFGASDGATAEVSADGAPQTSSSSATGTPPLPALVETFVVDKGCTSNAATMASLGLPIAETTFTIPAIPSVNTATRQVPSALPDATMIRVVNGSLRRPSSKRAPPVGKSLPYVVEYCQSYDELRKQCISTRLPSSDPADMSAFTVCAVSTDTTMLWQQI